MKKHLAKLLALVLALLLAFSLAACGGSTPEPAPAPAPAATEAPAATPAPAAEPAPAPEPEPEPETMAFNSKTPRDTLVVGTPAMNGDFINGFGNSSYDLSIKVLLNGHVGTYGTTPEGQIILNNTVVRNVSTSVDGDGNKTYAFEIHNDLKFSDGTTITANDFIASLLWYASPEAAAAGFSSSAGDGLLGYQAYKDGDTNVFAGAHVQGDFQFSLTIDAEQLPYFWETSYVSYGPLPLHSWSPGNSVVSDGSGAWFANSIADDAQRIAETERFAPTVVSGPYTFVSFDGSTVNLRRNPNFKGDLFGNLPQFEFIVQMEVPSETDVDMVLSGDIDLNTGNIEGSKIEKAKADPYGVAYSYLRAGYGFIGFPCDWGPTADANVRWGIAHMLDRNAIIDHVLEGYGGLVDSAYGMAQWAYQARRREIAQRLTPIAYNLARAHDFFDLTEWKFEADGTTPFNRELANPEGTYLRHNAAGEVFTINHLSAAPSVGSAIEAEAIRNGPLAGVNYQVTQGDFNTLLDHYYYGYDLGDERFYNAFNLASNFNVVDDRYWSWHSDLVGTWMNSNQLADDELDDIIMRMRRLEATQVDEYADLFVDFLVRWQELLPSFPLYSNEYFDIFNSVVTQVPTSPYANYQDVICLISKHP
jgi:peptide/nickel transport system substrate-binding protein